MRLGLCFVAASLVFLFPASHCLFAQSDDCLYRWNLLSEHYQQDQFKPVTGAAAARPVGSTVIDSDIEFDRQAPYACLLDAARHANQHLLVSDEPQTMALPADQITVEAWVRVEQPQEWGGLVGWLQDNGNHERGWLLGFRGAQFCFAVKSKSAGQLTYLTAEEHFQPGYWYHVIGVYDGIRQSLYVDGALAAQSSAQSGPIDYPEDGFLVIGAYRDENELYGMTGAIEQVSIYHAAWNAARVASRFDGRKSQFPSIEATPPPVRDWPTYQRDNLRTGISTERLQLPLALRWHYQAAHPPSPSWPPPAVQDFWNRKDNLQPRVIYDRAYHVVVAENRLYFGSSTDDQLVCLDARTGRELWSFFASGPVRLAPTVEQGRVVFAADDGQVYCLQAATGRLLWQFDAAQSARWIPGNGRLISERPVRSGTLIDSGVVFCCAGLFPSQGVTQYALDLETGKVLASGPLGISPQGYLARRSGRLFAPTGRDPAGSFVSQLERRGKDITAPIRQLPELFPYAFVGATGLRFGGGDGRVAAFDAETGQQLWTAEVDGAAYSLAIAGSCLYVSTDRGHIYCFQSESADTPPHQTTGEKPGAALAPPARSTADDVSPARQRAIEIRRFAAHDRGFCLVAGDQLSLAVELANETQWQIVVAVTDPQVVQAARRQLARLGLYGTRIAVHLVSADEPLPYADYVFNVVIGDSNERNRNTAREADWQRLARPGGGLVFPSRDTREPQIRPALAGAGAWTHMHADAANTNCSADTRVQGPLRLQWFGGPGPRQMIDRHHRTVAPLSCNGRLVIPGDELVICVDAYNGTLLWQLDVPGSRRIAAFRDCSYLVAVEDAVYVANGDHCLAIDPDRGELMRTFQMPATLAESPRQWGYLAVSGDLLYGSTVQPGASRREIGRTVIEKETFWDGVPLVCSDGLFATERGSGHVRWSYQAASGLIPNPTLAVSDGRVLFVESGNPETLSQPSGRARCQDLFSRQSFVVALDAASGDPLWRRPLDLSAIEHNVYLAIASGKVILVGSKNSGQDRNTAEVLYDIWVLDLQDGQTVWQHSQRQGTRIGGDHGEQDHRPVVVGQRLICEPFAYDLNTGIPLADWRWQNQHRRGCGNISASASTLFFRHQNPTMFDLQSSSYAKVTEVSRPGCWINMIPAGGLLLIPEASSGCTCNFPIQTSLAFVPESR